MPRAHCLRDLATGNTMMKDCAAAVSQMLPICEAMDQARGAGLKHTAALAPICKAACQDCADACRPHAGHHDECGACLQQRVKRRSQSWGERSCGLSNEDSLPARLQSPRQARAADQAFELERGALKKGLSRPKQSARRSSAVMDRQSAWQKPCVRVKLRPAKFFRTLRSIFAAEWPTLEISARSWA